MYLDFRYEQELFAESGSDSNDESYCMDKEIFAEEMDDDEDLLSTSVTGDQDDCKELFAEDSSDGMSEQSCDSVTKFKKVLKRPLPMKFFRKASTLEENLPNLIASENVCLKFCTHGCSKTIYEMSSSEKEAIRHYFVGKTKPETKNKLLHHLKTQRILDLSVANFRYKSQIYCVNAFSSVTGISEYLIGRVLKDFQLGFEQYTHGTKGVPRQSSAHLNFVSWMLVFVELHGQADPEKITSVLPAFLNKAELFKIYKKEATGPLLKVSTFYFLFKKNFGVNRSDKSMPNIRIRNGFSWLMSGPPPSPLPPLYDHKLSSTSHVYRADIYLLNPFFLVNIVVIVNAIFVLGLIISKVRAKLRPSWNSLLHLSLSIVNE